MPELKTYCQFVASVQNDNVHRIYHDTQYGFLINDDNELFGRLILEINQAGLNWTIILNKEGNFRKAYLDFNIQKVASFTKKDRERLLTDVGIIRNKLKVNAAIHNASEILKLQQGHGSFKNWLDKNHPMKLDNWLKLFKKTFKFTGGEITNEFLTSTGYLKGAHEKECPIYDKILLQNPLWNK